MITRRRLLIISIVLLSLFGAINYRWFRAAAVAAFSDRCDASLMESARHAVSELYGSVASRPIVACLDGPRFGLEVSHGLTNFAPGLPSVVLLGPAGAEANVAAHEWAHAEFAQRVGVIARLLFFPTWFDEGLAMQVDFRKDYDSEALVRYRAREDLRIPALDEISASEFFRADGQGKLHYALSRCVVGAWIERTPDWRSRIKDVGPFSSFPLGEFEGLCRG